MSGNMSGQDFTGRLISSFTTCAAVAGIPVSECEGLVALYDSTDGDNWDSYNEDGLEGDGCAVHVVGGDVCRGACDRA